MQKGILKKWNDEKGFGFIRPDDGMEDVFLHISSLRGLERRPVVGDIVHFDVALDEQGRRKAAHANIEGVQSVFTENKINRSVVKRSSKPASKSQTDYIPAHSRASRRPRALTRFINTIIVLVMVILGAKYYGRYQHIESQPLTETSLQSETKGDISITSSQYKCEGKTRCGQMTSCEEAMFYLNHCPGSVTDGDEDGLPCEDQWCGY